MDVRVYPPPAQPPSTAAASCLGPSRCPDTFYSNKCDSENMYMKLSEGMQDFAPGSQLYPVPGLETGVYHSPCPPIPQNGLHPFHPHSMDLPGITVSTMLSQDGRMPRGFLSSDPRMPHPDPQRCTGQPQMEAFRPSIQSVMMPHGHLTTINQSQLSGRHGLSGNNGQHGSPSPPGSKRATPSPSSSVQEEEVDESLKVSGAEKRPAADAGKKPKTQKKKKKKDPNEPQKPVSAYALFFRDTQATIKGQNPNATFGEVSKIVASTWDGLGEEQKQLYKKKTELAKKEYLKQLAAYRASMVSQSCNEASDVTTPQASQRAGSKLPVFLGAGLYHGHALQQQPGANPLLHPALPRSIVPQPGVPMPGPLPGTNMPPPALLPTMHQHASLQHQHQHQPVAMQRLPGNHQPLGNHPQLPLHSPTVPQGYPTQPEFHNMLNGMTTAGPSLAPSMDYSQSGGRNPSAQSVDWGVEYCSNGNLQGERALYLS
ncbi:hypothetical protein MATL_G00253300 [Megalops atlanticus]|uniref:HMG box domain-containing protein n=1 Tax=Megalops atlanticus TaxID=7932 RepID=A0A9D3PAY5_MEGAT|nr:hypothetical protein MATL_G00253300 [Megalops atlanticus]